MKANVAPFDFKDAVRPAPFRCLRNKALAVFSRHEFRAKSRGLVVKFEFSNREIAVAKNDNAVTDGLAEIKNLKRCFERRIKKGIAVLIGSQGFIQVRVSVVVQAMSVGLSPHRQRKCQQRP